MTPAFPRRAAWFIACVAAPLACGGLARAQSPAPTAAITRFQERKAELLLRERLPCLGCHTLNGEGGRVGPDLGTARERRSPEYIAAMITDPQRVVPGTLMPRTPMPDGVRDLVARYLATRPGAGTATAAVSPSSPPATRDGPGLYAAYCAACHGARGAGDGPNAAYLPVKPAQHASRDAMSKRSDDSLFDTIFGGGAIMNRSPRMPAYGGTLTRAEIRTLVAHIRALCRCSGPTWSSGGGRR
jgi:mono/diheme cytochrome c family protein